MFECLKKKACLNYPQRCPSCHACADMMMPYPLFNDRDLVEVVRCKNCKYCEILAPVKEIGKEAVIGYKCLLIGKYKNAEGFCDCGKKRYGE